MPKIETAFRLSIATDAVQDDIKEAGDVLTHFCHGLAKECGWWTNPETGAPLMANVPEKLMLIVSVVAESMESHRKGGTPDDKLPHRVGTEVELADAVIRIFDLAGGLGFDLPGAIAEKLRYNAGRSDHRLENRRLPGGKAY